MCSRPAADCQSDESAVLPSPTTEPLPISRGTLNVTPVDLSQPLPVVDPALLATANIDTKFEVGAQMGGVIQRRLLYAGRMHTKWIKIRRTLPVGAKSRRSAADHRRSAG